MDQKEQELISEPIDRLATLALYFSILIID